MSINLDTLNEAQKKAVTHQKGPLLIIAGAGTGKTTVITQKISYLILEKGVKTDEVLALTFTEKSAAEMEERIDQALPYGYVDLWVSTFHSFCEKILRQHGLDIGLPSDFKLLTQTEQWLLIRQNLNSFSLDYYRPIGNPTKFIHALISHFSRAKDEEVYPEQYLEYAKKNLNSGQLSIEPEVADEQKRIMEVASAYKVYQQLLLDNSYLDFGDLINYALKLLRERPSILKKYKDQFKYLLVDEFQDTNFAQYELIKLLAGEDANLTVVGDDDQSIYKFRGASISNILQFKKDYPQAAEVVLTENYRSAQEILDLSYNFIQLNNPNRLEAVLTSGKEKLSKKLTAANTRFHGQSPLNGGGKIDHLHYNTLDDEVEGVIFKILELKKKNKKLSWGDFAILVRANDSANTFVNFLKKTDIPHQFFALKGLYSTPIILDLVSYFKLLDNYHEGPAMYRILRSQFVNLNYKDTLEIIHHSNKKAQSVYQTIKNVSEVRAISYDTPSKINHLLKMIEKHSELAKTKPTSQVFIGFLQDSGIYDRLLKQESLADKIDMDNLQTFYKRIRAFEEASNDQLLKTFMAELELELESGESGSLSKEILAGPDVLNIMTIHSSKGLEFEYVFLPNMVDKRFPTIERSDAIELPEPLIKDIVPEGDIHMEEERRLFYVAMTRAKKGLFLSSAEDYGGLRKKKVSRFLVELEETNPKFKLAKKPEEKKPLMPDKIEIIEHQPDISPELPKMFSFSQLAGFNKCPYQYKLGFIYKIPIFGKGVFSYGKTLHSTLERFYKLVLERSAARQGDLFAVGKGGNHPLPSQAVAGITDIHNIMKASAGEGLTPSLEDKGGGAQLASRTVGNLVTLDEALDIFAGAWIDDWYRDAQEKNERLEKGREAITKYYNQVRNDVPRIKYLEKPFHLKIGNIETGEFYTIRGVIDRVDEGPDGRWHIIDYKSGGAKKTLEWEEKMQLLIYQLAAKEVFNATVDKLTYQYIDDSSEISFAGTEKEVARLKSELMDTISKIKNSHFSATPGRQCQFCDFKSICEFRLL